jgi:hypothetical protein
MSDPIEGPTPSGSAGTPGRFGEAIARTKRAPVRRRTSERMR